MVGVRQAKAVGGRLLPCGDEDGVDHADLAVGGTLGGLAGARGGTHGDPADYPGGRPLARLNL